MHGDDQGGSGVVEQGIYLVSLRELAAKTDQLVCAVQSGLWDQVLMALAEREALIAIIEQMENPQEALDQEEREQAIGLLQQINQQDAQSLVTVEQTLAYTGKEMKRGQLARTTLSAYRKATQSSGRSLAPRFVDEQQ